MVATWTKVVNSAAFSARDEGRVVKHNGLVWLAHGYRVGGISTDDLYRSSDGITWSLVNSNLPCKAWSPVCSHNGAIYFVDDLACVKTTDGVNFTTVSTTGLPTYSPNDYMVSFNGKMCFVSDAVYTSADGAEWSSTALPFPRRNSFVTAVFNGRIYVMGGVINVPNSPAEIGYPLLTSLNSVWSTDDPDNLGAWVNHGNAPWAPRMWPGATEHAGWLYLMGGYNNKYTNSTVQNFNDTWRFDGTNWSQRGMQTAFVQRHAPTPYSHRGSLYLAAGNTNVGGSVQNDIWKASDISPALTNEELTVLAGIF